MSITLVYNQLEKNKLQEVEKMFNSISYQYDFMNRLMSLNIDKQWRKKALKSIKKKLPSKPKVLDIATGTGDFAFESIKYLNPEKVIGVDISKPMLALAQKKAKQKKHRDIFHTSCAPVENLPFPPSSFDLVTVAFGVRNFANIPQGLKEIKRMLKKDGHVLILEFSMPKNLFLKIFYFFYMACFIPVMGKLITGNAKAYTYLYKSIKAFPQPKAFLNILKNSGLIPIETKSYITNICHMYILKN